MKSFAWLISLPMVAEAGEVLWSGLFDAAATVADIDKCKLAPHYCTISIKAYTDR
jgi:hypothetical protein